jgi:hypothetical protein
MAQYENMMITVTIMLIFINAWFAFFGGLPGVAIQDWNNVEDYQKLNLGMTDYDMQQMRNKLDGILDDSNVLVGPSSDGIDITASPTQKTYLTLFQEWMFGVADTITFGGAGAILQATSLLGSMITLFGATFFGYLFWIDFFIPQGTIFGFEIIGTALKIFLFIIQMLGIFDIIFRVFSAGTGARG